MPNRRVSNRLFIRFEDTNLPDFTIPGNTIGPLGVREDITTSIYQPIETISLYEEFRTGEEVLKAQVAINSLVANVEWVPNGIFPRSLGVNLNDNGNLGDPGIPGIGILNGGGSGASSGAPEKSSTAAPGTAKSLKSGFVFSGDVPTPPDNNPESSELVLLSVDVDDSLISMDVGDSYDFFLRGNFYNTGTGLLEEYSANTVDWSVTEPDLPAEGLSIADDSGAFEADHYPGVEYTRSVVIRATTSEGAPLDGEGRPIEYSDSHNLDITEPTSHRTYAEWVSDNAIPEGDDALQTADPDGDQIINLLEYVLDTNPLAANRMTGTSHEYDADTGNLTYRFTVPNDLSEVTMKIQTSPDLDTWTDRAMTLESSDSSTNTWATTVNLGGLGFARMCVETYTPAP